MGVKYNFVCKDITEDVREYSVSAAHGTVFSPSTYIIISILLILLLLQLWTNIGVSLSLPIAALVLLLTISIFIKRNSVKEESLLIIRDTGLQLNKKFYNGEEKHLFIDKTKISAIVINEGIRSYDVLFYMAVIVEGHDRMVLVFEDLIPKLCILLQIYRGARSIMWGEPER